MLDKRGNKVLSTLGRWTKYVDRLSFGIQRPFKYAAFFIMCLITLEVFLRYVMKAPTIWGIDIRSQVYGTSLMFAASYTLIVRGHVTVDILMVALPLTKARLLEFFNYIFFFAPSVAAIAISQSLMARRAWMILEHDKTLWSPPVYPFKTALALAYWVLLLTGVSEAVKDLITSRNGDEEWLKER